MAKAKKDVKKAGNQAKASKPAKKGAGFGYKILGFLLLILGLMLLPSSTLLMAGMLPTFIAFLTDSDRRKTSAISVGTVNICGVIPFEIQLWEGANTMAQVGQMLRHVETWAVMYGAAVIGSVIYYAVPPVVGGFIALQSAARVAELERKQAQLREAWGDEVSKAPAASGKSAKAA
ncbi:MAG TPA: hypothetical protein VKZ79_21745 [Alphaproteobacteria bacterium]|nr:hypothetical protein [Alphaproteobacteria bacterium]